MHGSTELLACAAADECQSKCDCTKWRKANRLLQLSWLFFLKHTCYLCHHIQFSSHLLLALDDFSTDVYCLLSCVHHSPTTLENAIKTTPLLRNRLSLTFTMEGRSNDIWSASHKILRTTSNQISSTGREQITTQHTVFLG